MNKIKNNNTDTKLVDGVYNDGAFIRLVFSGSMIQVNKSQIKTIDTVRNDIVRLDIGEGALKNIYIRLNEVSYPQGLKNVTELRNYIKGLMILNGFSTEAKQDAVIVELQQMKLLLADMKNAFQNKTVGVLLTVKQPLREDDSQPNILYKGFAIPNANNSEPQWAIQRISRTDREIIYEWAEGNELCNKVWEKRYDLQYFPSGYIK